jgi:tetraacyldisaccharide 4'-kinase
MLPAGPLRESVRALDRAHVVISTEPVATGAYLVRKPVGLVAWPGAAGVEALSALAGARVTAVAGIARTDGFVAMLREAGATVADVMRFPDHHRYSSADWARIVGRARGSERVVTTEKDLVKLARFRTGGQRLSALRIDLDVHGAETLIDQICARAELDPKGRGQHDRALP